MEEAKLGPFECCIGTIGRECCDKFAGETANLGAESFRPEKCPYRRHFAKRSLDTVPNLVMIFIVLRIA